MPILDVQLIGAVPRDLRAGLAQRIADAAAEVLRSRPQGTWVKLHFIATDAYAENAGGPHRGDRARLRAGRFAAASRASTRGIPRPRGVCL